MKWLSLWVLIGVLASASGCGGGAPSQARADQQAAGPAADGSVARRGVPLERVAAEPGMRVRVERGVERVELRAVGEAGMAGGMTGGGEAGGGLRVRIANGSGVVQEVRSPTTVTRVDNTFAFQRRRQTVLVMTAGEAGLRVSGEGGVALGGRRYPGDLVLRAAAGSERSATRMDVVNHVAMEAYLPGVLERELYASWPAAAFEAQAVAARSYAIWERAMQRGRDPARGWDLEGDVASQAYAGHATNPKAVDAVRRTRGVVLAWDGRVLPAFYSSACGGRGQDAAAVFADRVDDLPPLRGAVRAACCEASPKHRWRARRDAATLATRLAAWGRATRHPVAGLRGLSDVTTARRNAAGRPTRYRIADAAGRAYELDAEQFRFACNFEGPGAPPLAAGVRLPSSSLEPSVQEGRVSFEHGGGYGHGVGLCQWGARGRAAAGDDYQRVLAEYYPGATPVRAYH